MIHQLPRNMTIELLNHIDELHTTQLEMQRIRKNLKLDDSTDPV